MADEQSTLMQVRFLPTAPAEASFRLVRVDGSEKTAHFTIAADAPARTLVGKSSACAIILQDPTVSRRHASLDIVGARLRITDLESRNGTYLNEIPILDAFASGGEMVRFGSTSLMIGSHRQANPIDLPAEVQFGKTIGASTEMRRLYPLCQRLANADVPVIIEGETGTGKEALAESLHMMGKRKNGPFVVFDCTAVPPSLIESELFGHRRGAFTGATTDRKGVFELAKGGTILIDEIGDLELSLQAKLLRVIDRGELRPVGSETPVAVDARVIAATRRDLDREAQAGRFRDDLLYRLSVARIELPPLRERKGDVRVLAHRFWEELSQEEQPIPASTLLRWEDEAWPGNVRELRNAVARHLVLGELDELAGATTPEPATMTSRGADFDVLVSNVLAEGLPLREAREKVVLEFERRYVIETLRAQNGNVTHAAAQAGVARRYFQKLKTKLGQ